MGRKYYSGDGGYPSGWKGLKTVRQQVIEYEIFVVAYDEYDEEIPRYFDGSQVEKLAANIVVPPGWDGIAVVPKPRKLSNLYRGKTKGYEYNKAYAHILQVLVHARGLSSNPGLAFGTESRVMTNMFYQRLMSQPGDFLVFAVQLGRAHHHQRMSYEMTTLADYEVPLDGYLAACILLAHPERLATVDTSGVYCPGAYLRDDPERIPNFRRAGIPQGDGSIEDERLQVKHVLTSDSGWIATARIPGL
ncbi:MAG: hypothetical protein WC551_05965 [Patescibacteria group bacterium]